MSQFWAGLAIFFGSHFFGAVFRETRAALIMRTGEGAYKAIYSLVSLIGLILIVRGWPDASTAVIYTPPLWLQPLTYLLTAAGFILLWAAYLPAGRIKVAAQHPMLAGVKLWAFAHLMANGDVRSVALFGGFLAFAVIDRVLVKRRGERGPTAGRPLWDGVAIIGGLGGTALTVFHLHPYLAGVPLYPGATLGALFGG